MNNTFSSEQLSKTGNFDSIFILRQYKLHLMASFMEIKAVNSKLGQDQIANELCCSSCTLKRYRNDRNMLSHYRISQNIHKIRQKISNANFVHNSNRKHGLKRTSNDPKSPQKVEPDKLVSNVVSTNKKNKLKGGFLKENHETNDNYFDEIFHKNNL